RPLPGPDLRGRPENEFDCQWRIATSNLPSSAKSKDVDVLIDGPSERPMPINDCSVAALRLRLAMLAEKLPAL
ncbi:MAG: hypothetical protein KDH88_20750, partial [Chromatiales bacterium]|nr:hypothetical protein [Chromatiales bacterium]